MFCLTNARCFSKTWTYRNEGSPDWIFKNAWLLKSDFSRSWSETAAQRHTQTYPFHSEPQHCGAVSVCRKLIAPKNNASLVQVPSFHSLGICTECTLGRRLEHFCTGEDPLQCILRALLTGKYSWELWALIYWEKRCGKISSHFICLSLETREASWDKHGDSQQSLCASSQLPRPGDTELRSFFKNACRLNSTSAWSTRSQS